MVTHIRYLAYFLIVQGLLEAIPGGILTAFGLAAAFGIARGSELHEVFPGTLAFVVLLLGPAVLIAGVFKVIAGFRVLKTEDRTMGLIAVGSAVFSVPTCYCAPTALILLVYGLVVLLDRDVRRAFAANDSASPGSPV